MQHKYMFVNNFIQKNQKIKDLIKWNPMNTKLMHGKPSKCHANSANLWEQNKDITRICTGYALSKDGMWRQHSWLVWHKARSNQIVETTVKRIAYYGFVMTYDMCQQFADENY